MSEDLIVARVDKARLLLCQARDASDAKQVADLARAAEVYARRQKLSEEAIGYATAVKVDAMTMMAEFLKVAKEQGGATVFCPDGKKPGGRPEVIPSQLKGHVSSDAQALLDLKDDDPETFEQVRAGKVTVRNGANKVRTAKRSERKRAAMEQRAAAAPATADRWQVIAGDAADELAQLKECPRLIFADPPYNQGIDYGQGTGADRLRPDQYLACCERWMQAAADALAPDGSLWVLISDEYADHFGLLLRKAGLNRRQWLIWYEAFGVCDADKRGFARSSRHLLWYIKDPHDYVFNPEPITRPSARQMKYHDRRANPEGRTWDSVWGLDPPIPRLTGTCAERIPTFPTQLPLALLLPIIACASDPGDLILDPFNGSGTTGVAALRLSRQYIGIEKSEEFARLSRLRLQGERP